jgi:SulP family sulfate permease
LHLPVETIGSRFGGIPQSLPAFSWPAFSWAQITALMPEGTTIALLAAIESLLSAVVADGMINGRHKSNMELVAQGFANIGSALFGGIPATGAIARTATNVKNGGRTPVAGIVHSLTLLLILLAAGQFASNIPLAALAGILVVVSYHMSEWRSFRTLLSGPRSDIVVLITTFSLTILVDLTVAVEVGMVLAAFLFMRHMAQLSHVKVVQPDPVNGEAEGRRGIPPDVQVYSAHGAFFFGAAHKLIETLRIVGKAPKALVLDMTGVLHMDASGLHVLEQIAGECRSRGSAFRIVGIHSQPLFVLVEAGAYTRIGEKSFFPTLAEAFAVT